MALLKRVSRLAGTVSAAFGGSLGEPIDIMRRGSVVAAAQLGPASRHFRSSRNMASWADFLGAHGHGAVSCGCRLRACALLASAAGCALVVVWGGGEGGCGRRHCSRAAGPGSRQVCSVHRHSAPRHALTIILPIIHALQEPTAEPSVHAEPAPARGVDLAPVLEAPVEEALGWDLSWVEGLTVAQLKGELRARSLKVSGRKAELQVRLWDALA